MNKCQETRLKIFSSASHEKIEEEFNEWMSKHYWDIHEIKIFDTKYGHTIYVFYSTK
jgi:endonuclease III